MNNDNAFEYYLKKAGLTTFPDDIMRNLTTCKRKSKIKDPK